MTETTNGEENIKFQVCLGATVDHMNNHVSHFWVLLERPTINTTIFYHSIRNLNQFLLRSELVLTHNKCCSYNEKKSEENEILHCGTKNIKGSRSPGEIANDAVDLANATKTNKNEI